MNKNFKPDPFEEFVKNSLDNLDVDYNQGHWNEIEQKLDELWPEKKGNAGNNAGILKTIGLVLIASATTYLVIDNLPESQNEVKLKEVSSDRISVPVVTANQNNELHENASPENSINGTQATNTRVTDGNLTVKTKAGLKADKEEIDPFNTRSNASQSYMSYLENKDGDSNDDLPSTEFLVDEKSGCGSLEVAFVPLAQSDDYIYHWNFGDGTYSNETTVRHLYNRGEYTASLSLISKKNGSVYESDVQKIKISEKPKADFKWEYNTAGYMNYAVNFIDKSEGSSSFEWNFGDNEFSKSRNPNHNYLSKGTYSVELTVRNDAGCEDRFQQVIALEESNKLLAPNSFTPDGDGLNDMFIPKKLAELDAEFEMYIYDKANNLVYKTNDSSRPWNGTLNNVGNSYPNGSTFVWVVIIKNSTGEHQRHTGIISMIK